MTGRDPVTPELALYVIGRDRGCLAGSWFNEPDCGGRLQLDHVKDQPKVGDQVQKRGPARKHRYRAASDPAHLVSLCERHHLGGWATSHRPELRQYLSQERGNE